jgi:hypothetical protein
VETLTEFEERATPTGEDENENGNRNENGNVEGYERGNTVVSETTSWDYDLDVGIQLDPSLFASPGEHIAFVYCERDSAPFVPLRAFI